MDYTPITPFRRTVDAAILKHQIANQEVVPSKAVNKWDILKELATARISFGLSNRDLTVLQALISFHPSTMFDSTDIPLVVYPSNKSICERLNGMPCSTMRRHLAKLVQSGFVVRRDSPNGKRYARRHAGEKVAFGFDLSPLVRRFPEVQKAAAVTRAEQELNARLRTSASLMRRDLASLAEFGHTQHGDLNQWDQFSDLATLTARALRRKLTTQELEDLLSTLTDAVCRIQRLIESLDTEKTISSGAQNERRYQSSDTEYEKEKASTSAGTSVDHCQDYPIPAVACSTTYREYSPKAPLQLVLTVCQSFLTFTEHPVRGWNDLISAAETLRPMMGISQSVWREAIRVMGAEEAAIVLVAMLERFSDIKSPAAYLRFLSRKAEKGAFSSRPMLMALMQKEAA